ncbi:uncharacterized protein [Palaemon carinicauda]|uniref:uncharacterized protein n=1 Tax=Palaemon carinicauda TaxID=392227 RepID=UPI0035B5A17E
MYKLVIIAIVAAVAAAQNPALAPLTRLSLQDIQRVMADAPRVRFIVSCLVAKKSCPEDELADPMQVLVSSWASSNSICGACSPDDQRKTKAMISILQQQYNTEYQKVAQAYGLL